MSVNVLYKTSAKATGGRDGHSATLDGALDVRLTTPKELGGAGGAGNNPEQLFAAGYAACFIGAMKFVASQGGPKVPADTSVTSTVGIGPRSAGGFGLGLISKAIEPFWGAVLAKIAVLVLIVLFIQKRPQGMFALKGRSAEA